jgi:glycosyltransferase involved in cell wall biosynthesis
LDPPVKPEDDVRRRTKHLAIIYTPTQYYWVRPEEYSENTGGGILSPFLKYGLKLLIKPMRAWDYRAAQKPDQILAISTSVQLRIKKFYGRDSVVVYPPVTTSRFAKKQPKPADAPEKYLLTVGRQVPYKRFDLAIEAAKILGRDLVMIGNGPEHERLVAMAALGASSSRRRGPIDSSGVVLDPPVKPEDDVHSKVIFPSNISDAEIVGYFQHADALLFPGEDDFGITAVEALAAGTPVVAYKAGGALDYTIPSTNGIFFDKFDADELALAVEKLKTADSDKIIKTAAAFDVQVFSQKISQKVQEVLQS